jgi:hypothetical protein
MSAERVGRQRPEVGSVHLRVTAEPEVGVHEHEFRRRVPSRGRQTSTTLMEIVQMVLEGDLGARTCLGS